jgi:nucleoside-diphosphate-sugar epimerase
VRGGTTYRMTRIAVTGGSGRLGRAVVRDLDEHGYDVVNLDRVEPPEDAPGDFVRVDLTDYGQTFQALSRIEDRYDHVDGVVHLAAFPAPGLVPNTTTFVNNISSTHHVFAAARAAGITNVVWASSETVLGLPFDTPPPYIPVDEEYHPRPESSYSLAKTLEEEMAGQLCRWDPGLKMIGLRLSNVMYPEDYAQFPSFDEDPLLRKWNLWGYIDARDGAQACRLALEHDATGRDVFIIANADTVMSTPSAELAAAVFPGVEVRGDVSGTVTLLSIDKARRVLGYQPAYSWRDEVLPDGGA